MRGRIVCILAVLAVLLGVGIPCRAAEEEGSIRVMLTREEDRTYYGSVSLYRVGTPVSGGYRLGSGYGGGFVDAKDAQAPALAQWLAERAGIADGIRILDSDGSGEFRRLEKGLYLLVQTDPAEGFYPFVPFLVQLPYEGQWEILALPKMESVPVEAPQTGDNFKLSSYVITMVASGLGLVVCLVGKKRRI